VKIELSFMKHYNEPNLIVQLSQFAPKMQPTPDKSTEANAEEKKEETNQTKNAKEGMSENWEVWLSLKYNPLKGQWETPIVKKSVILQPDAVRERKSSMWDALRTLLSKDKDKDKDKDKQGETEKGKEGAEK